MEGLEVIESSRLLVDQLTKEGGATPPGSCNQNLPGGRLWDSIANFVCDI